MYSLDTVSVSSCECAYIRKSVFVGVKSHITHLSSNLCAASVLQVRSYIIQVAINNSSNIFSVIFDSPATPLIFSSNTDQVFELTPCSVLNQSINSSRQHLFGFPPCFSLIAFTVGILKRKA